MTKDEEAVAMAAKALLGCTRDLQLASSNHEANALTVATGIALGSGVPDAQELEKAIAGYSKILADTARNTFRIVHEHEHRSLQ